MHFRNGKFNGEIYVVAPSGMQQIRTFIHCTVEIVQRDRKLGVYSAVHTQDIMYLTWRMDGDSHHHRSAINKRVSSNDHCVVIHGSIVHEPEPSHRTRNHDTKNDAESRTATQIAPSRTSTRTSSFRTVKKPCLKFTYNRRALFFIFGTNVVIKRTNIQD